MTPLKNKHCHFLLNKPKPTKLIDSRENVNGFYYLFLINDVSHQEIAVMLAFN